LATKLSELPAGWLSEAEAEALASLATGKTVLEVGSWLGRSTVAMARTAALVVSVDHHRGSLEHQAEPYKDPVLRDPVSGDYSTLRRFVANLEESGVRDRVVPIVAPFASVAPLLERIFDFAFIDAQHDYQSVMDDAGLAWGCVKHGGPLVFHDYGEWSGVVSAVAALQRHWRASLEVPAGTTLAVLHIPYSDL
jgi:predicted O-methyltransferase YrrM